MQIRAAVLEEFGAPLVVRHVELAEPKAGGVLVRLVPCGVCPTALYTASGADPSGYAPTVLGHEGAGVVERVGENVASLAPGDHVVTLFSPQCRECIHCRDPRTNLCLAIREQQNQGFLPDGTTRLSRDGEPIRHFMGTSTFAEYPVSTCVVFGPGLVGLGAVAGCRLSGAERIVCVDPAEQRLELARGQGATDTLAGGPPGLEQILEVTGGLRGHLTVWGT